MISRLIFVGLISRDVVLVAWCYNVVRTESTNRDLAVVLKRLGGVDLYSQVGRNEEVTE